MNLVEKQNFWATNIFITKNCQLVTDADGVRCLAANVLGICEGGYVGTSNYAVTVQPLLQIPCYRQWGMFSTKAD